jgi:hypothetical protein
LIDQTPIGPQHVLDGFERVSDKTIAERRWTAPKRATARQKDAGPLFSDQAQQVNLMDLLR